MCDFIIYLFIWEWQIYNEKEQNICWFPPQVATTVRAEPIQCQEQKDTGVLALTLSHCAGPSML